MMNPEEIKDVKKIMGIEESNNDYIYIEGAGYGWEIGKLNLEAFIKRLLESKYITGN